MENISGNIFWSKTVVALQVYKKYTETNYDGINQYFNYELQMALNALYANGFVDWIVSRCGTESMETDKWASSWNDDCYNYEFNAVQTKKPSKLNRIIFLTQ